MMKTAFQKFVNHARRFRETTQDIHRETLVDVIEILGKGASKEAKDEAIRLVKNREGIAFNN